MFDYLCLTVEVAVHDRWLSDDLPDLIQQLGVVPSG
jgi:hypothetical protein